ncbi:ankyrin repeat protein [Xylaria curta]|nr:ankyrin repeat protein [Xylaria curta]
MSSPQNASSFANDHENNYTSPSIPPQLPTPPSQFLSHLSENPKTITRELLKPYLDYENWLRRAFMRDDAEIDNLANIVPIYDGYETEFKIRTIDRDTANPEKYIMPLSYPPRQEHGVLAITPSMEEYDLNFEGFSHDWSNVVAAGSSALLPLLPRRSSAKMNDNQHVEKAPEAYFEAVAGSSDIDLFLYGLDSEEAAITRIRQLESVVRKNQRLSPGKGLCLRSDNAITFISPKYPYRHVQIILRLYRSISEILTGFDVDCACVAFDGTQVYSNPRGITAVATSTNTIDLSRRSPSYENRLWKYRNHYFDVFWDSLDRSRITTDFTPPCDIKELTGLARLLFSEQVGGCWSRRQEYWRIRNLHNIEDSGRQNLSAPSGYATFIIPYGKSFSAERIREHVKYYIKNACFGTIEEVITGEVQSESGRFGAVTFIKDNPGRQMIGSFYPLDEDDW